MRCRPAAAPRALEPESWTWLGASRGRLPGDPGKEGVHFPYGLSHDPVEVTFWPFGAARAPDRSGPAPSPPPRFIARLVS